MTEEILDPEVIAASENVVLFRFPPHVESMDGINAEERGVTGKTYTAIGKKKAMGVAFLCAKETEWRCELGEAIILCGDPEKLPWL